MAPGEIAASDLARLCSSLQELATRVGRWTCESRPTGRLPKESEEITRVRVSGLAHGSTRLVVSTEPAQPMLDGLAVDTDEVDRRFWRIIHDGGGGTFPRDAPAAVRESAGRFLESVRGAREVEITGRSPGLDHRPVRFEPMRVRQNPWFDDLTPSAAAAPETIHGRLTMIDLQRNRFRVDSPDGTSTELRDMPDPWSTAHLVGQHVVVSGIPERAGSRAVMRSPALEPSGLPDWRAVTEAQTQAFWEALDAAHPFDPSTVRVLDLTDEECEAFWSVVGGE